MDRPIRIIHSQFDEFSALGVHEVVRVQLRCGKEYAIDPTGLQMGWNNTIVPWDMYLHQHVHRIESTEKTARMLRPGEAIAEDLMFGSGPVLHHQPPRAQLAETVAHGVDTLIRQRGPGEPGVKQILHLAGSNFATCRANLVSAMKRGIDSTVQARLRGAKVDINLRNQGAELNFMNPMHHCFDLLWCSAKDYAKPNGWEKLAGFDKRAHSLSVDDGLRRRWHAALDLGPLPGIDRA